MRQRSSIRAMCWTNGYILKPNELHAFSEAIHAMEAYWLTVAILSLPPVSL